MSEFKSADELISAIKQILTSSQEQLSLIAAKSAEASLKRRVFNDGKDVSGGQIGQYSTKPRSFSKDNFVVKSKFRADRDSEGMFIADGYAGLRRLNGRQADYVDLNFSGSLMRSIAVQATGSGHAVVISNDSEAKIAEANEKRFRTVIFAASANEIELMREAVQEEINKLFDGL